MPSDGSATLSGNCRREPSASSHRPSRAVIASVLSCGQDVAIALARFTGCAATSSARPDWITRPPATTVISPLSASASPALAASKTTTPVACASSPGRASSSSSLATGSNCAVGPSMISNAGRAATACASASFIRCTAERLESLSSTRADRPASAATSRPATRPTFWPDAGRPDGPTRSTRPLAPFAFEMCSPPSLISPACGRSAPETRRANASRPASGNPTIPVGRPAAISSETLLSSIPPPAPRETSFSSSIAHTAVCPVPSCLRPSAANTRAPRALSPREGARQTPSLKSCMRPRRLKTWPCDSLLPA